MRIAGMISGTSFDAIDVAVADLAVDDGVITLRPLGLHSTDIPDALRARIADVLPPRTTTIDEVCRLDTELGQLFGSAAAPACAAVGGVDLVVSHGQTVYHWVDGDRARGTLQLGAPAWIAAATGLPVVSDLRSRDIVAGGHGAPLASTLDALLLLHDTTRRRGALNLGGIANITVLGADDAVLAYDIGPANALIDAAVAAQTGGRERMDRDGAHAASGHVNAALLERLLAEPYYRLPSPKSTGKELFHAGYLAGLAADVSGDDLVTTLTELTAVLVGDACRAYRLHELIVSGGGVRNPVLMERIATRIAPARVRPVDEFGLPAQAKEAYLFALLGFLTVHGLAGSIPSATGAAAPVILGSITPGAGPLRLPEPVALAPRGLRIDA